MPTISLSTKYRLPEATHLNKAPVKKRSVVWHFDAGASVEATFQTFMGWRNKAGQISKVGVPYCIGRDGVVYELYNPEQYWTWHTATGEDLDMVSIGIELQNVGPLRLKDGILYWWPPLMRFETPYCKLEETGKYMDLGKAWRGERYWASYTEPQLDAAEKLSHYISERFDIPRQMPKERAPEKLTFADISFYKRQPVLAHHHVRTDKVDVGPLFPWERVCQL